MKAKNVDDITNYVMLCIMSIGIQIGVLNLYIEQMKNDKSKIFFGDTSLNVSRIICQVMAFLSMYPGIRDPINMLQFCVTQKKQFYQQKVSFPALVAIMRAIGTVSMQAFTLYAVMFKKDNISVINSYMTNYLLVRIESIIAVAAAPYGIAGRMKDDPITYTDDCAVFDEFNYIKTFDENMNFLEKIGWVLLVISLKFFRVFYKVVYFYFSPFYVVAFLFYYEAFYVY